MTSLTIREVMSDPELLGGVFSKPSWAAWKAVLWGLYGLSMNDDEADIFRALTARTTLPTVPFTEAVFCCGRRGGKSRVLALIAVYLSCFRSYEEYLAPGEVATVAVMAADRRQARSIFRFVAGMLHERPMLKNLIIDETGEAITLKNRVVIEIATASFRSTRGYNYAAILCDEVAFWRSEESSANPANEILRALRPGMGPIPGAILLMASSPYAKAGPLYDAFRQYYGRDGADVLFIKAPTATMNPIVPAKVIERAYAEDPESARAEYGAEFRDDLAAYVTREMLDAVTCWGRHELPPQEGVEYTAFCDPSGGVSDAMTLAIGHLQDGEIGVLDALLELRPPFNPDEAVTQCAALMAQYGVVRCVGDRFAGQWPVARFAANGISFEQSARPKSDLYGDVLPLINAGRIELLDNPRLTAQFVGLERRVARSGKDSIDHSPGGHDDLCNAVAGVLVGLELDRRPAMVKRSDLFVDGEPVPPPSKCDYVCAITMLDKSGRVATVFFARNMYYGVPAIVMDFETTYLSARMFNDVALRGEELSVECGARQQFKYYSSTAVLGLAASARVFVREIPDALLDPVGLMNSASFQARSGFVKLSALAYEKSHTSTLGQAFDFRSGADPTENALRMALVMGIRAMAENDSGVPANY